MEIFVNRKECIKIVKRVEQKKKIAPYNSNSGHPVVELIVGKTNS